MIEAQCGNLLPSLCLWCGHLCDLYFETTPKFSTKVRQGGPSCHFMWVAHLLAWGPTLLPSCNIALSGPAKKLEPFLRFLGKNITYRWSSELSQIQGVCHWVFHDKRPKYFGLCQKLHVNKYNVIGSNPNTNETTPLKDDLKHINLELADIQHLETWWFDYVSNF